MLVFLQHIHIINCISSAVQLTKSEVIRLLPRTRSQNSTAKGTQPCGYSRKSSYCLKLRLWEPTGASYFNHKLYISRNAAFHFIDCHFQERRVFFFLLLHSMEVFLLTLSIIKNQSNKVTFSNLNTGYKKLNCQFSLPNGTVAPTLRPKDFQESD